MSTSMWKEIEKNDLIGKLKPLFMNGRLYVDPEDNKIRRVKQVMHVNNPWIFIQQPDWINCGLWHQIYFDQLKIIHSACFSCFKVVVTPKTVKELFQLYDIMLSLDLPSKCGAELRPYVDRLYGGYFYCKDLDNGRQIYDLVKPIVQREIREDIDIILKRGCTEFEQLHGDSSKYEQTEHDSNLERILDENSDIPIQVMTQPEIVKNHVKRMWLAWAYKNKDWTCLEFNDGEDLDDNKPQKPTTYHEPIKDQ